MRCPTRIAAHILLLASTLASAGLMVGVDGRAGPLPPSIRGKVAGWEKLLPQVYTDASKNESHRYTWREPSPTVKQEFRRLSANPSRDVCVVALSSAPSQPHEPLTVKLTGGRLSPATIVLSPGSRLSFKNSDPFPHVLFEVGNDKWAPNPTAPGSTREWAAPAAGVHEIRDQLFSTVVLFVVVDPAAVEVAFPDRDGGFSMSVPQGDYSLRAFFDGKPTGKEVTGLHVGERGVVELREPLTLGGDAK
jgi:hypothetical protein